MTHDSVFLGVLVGTDGANLGDDKRLILHWTNPASPTVLHALFVFETFQEIICPCDSFFDIINEQGGGIDKWDKNCHTLLENFLLVVCSAHIIEPPDWFKSFNAHAVASELAVGGTLTQDYHDGNER